LAGMAGGPILYRSPPATNPIRTTPVLQHDPDGPEDLDTTAEDHAADEWRYACLSRPWVRITAPAPVRKVFALGPACTVTLNDLWEAEESAARKRRRAV